eukprot:CAMPEP_0174723026 /NCGR_PEP_ID=MMETSP1094-20130205/39858_1 /TAXON_ID=156173 /ORGANISM="Chrysochromulina brevifilum, Strain UTEX LB 985" /LENGTH=63 /DNA_ID=CAMNT_0015923995 /DNA_START=176 /DNA_END=363 /DNA_ORIENTATION=-
MTDWGWYKGKCTRNGPRAYILQECLVVLSCACGSVCAVAVRECVRVNAESDCHKYVVHKLVTT